MSESLALNHISYDRRKQVSEKLREIMRSKNGSAYFNAVVSPNMLPEDIPVDLPRNVTWIGEIDRRSFAQSREAMGDLLVQVVDLGDLHVEDAVICADSLDIACFYDTAVYTLDPAVKSRPEKAAETLKSDLATVSQLPERVIPNPFGELADVLTFSPKVSLIRRAVSAGLAEIIPIEPEPTMAKILQFPPLVIT